MFRRLLVIAVATIGVAAWLDRTLARRGAAVPIRTFVVVDAPPGRVWAELVDIEAQPRWQREMKAVRVLTGPAIGVGTRAEARVRILGIGVTDPVTIVGFDPPRRFAIRHEGRYRGSGTIELEPGADGTSTIVSWTETLVPPVFPHLGALVQAPILRRIFQSDLGRFQTLIERPTDAGGPAGSRAADRLASAGAEIPPRSEGGPPSRRGTTVAA